MGGLTSLGFIGWHHPITNELSTVLPINQAGCKVDKSR